MYDGDISRASISRILAIRLAGIGDVVLALPALRRLKADFAGSELTLLTDSRCVPLARLSPDLDRVIDIDRKKLKNDSWPGAGWDILGLVRTLRAARFDLAVDFHGLFETNLLCGVAGAPYRMGIRRPGKVYLDVCFNLEPAVEHPGLHLRDIFEAAVGKIAGGVAIPSGAPVIRVPEAARRRAADLAGPGPAVALYVGASRVGHRWTPEGFAAVAVHAAREWGASVFVLAGASPVEEAIADAVRAGTGGDPRIHLLKGLDIASVTGMIARVDLLVSNDSAPMHIGTALGVPTIGVFGASSVARYAPRGPMDRCVKRRRIEDVEPDDVIVAMDETWAAVRA